MSDVFVYFVAFSIVASAVAVIVWLGTRKDDKPEYSGCTAHTFRAEIRESIWGNDLDQQQYDRQKFLARRAVYKQTHRLNRLCSRFNAHGRPVKQTVIRDRHMALEAWSM